MPENELSTEQLKRLADFFNEVGMLKKTPRSGFAFLGSGKESVAEHSYRVSVIGFALATLTGADPALTSFLCMFHDLHEARTGDFNYVNHRYDTCRARDALCDCAQGTGLENDILHFWDEFEKGGSPEALLARDADQLDLICNLQMELKMGNQYAREWLESALERLRLPVSRQLAEMILRVDPSDWWYRGIDKEWWINHGRKEND